MTANGYQVGGLHYKSSYEHWDLVVLLDQNYLEGCATAYVVRWRKKSTPILDLKKALHFLNKLEELTQELRPARTTLLNPVEVWEEVQRFALANNLSALECRFLTLMSTWRGVEELEEARQVLFALLDEAEKLHGPSPVPLTEENHYAERFGAAYED
jgi:hypothetical protein